MPKDVETRFLNQTIKVFTKVGSNVRCEFNSFSVLPYTQVTLLCSLQIDPASVKNEPLYTALKAILTPVLQELCDRDTEESDNS